MKRVVVLMTIISLFVVNVLAGGAWDGVSVASGFSGGDGSRDNPFLIGSAEELAFLAKQVNESGVNFKNKHFKLTADIDLNRKQWTPIGTHEGGTSVQAQFNGNVDGDGYVIANLYINMPDKSDVGLFGFIEGDTIKNLGIVGNSEIIGKDNVGALAGKCYSSAGKPHTAIFNCFSSAKVTATGSVCGGLVGSMYKRNTLIRIYNCYTTGSVSGYGDVGGIVGSAGRYEGGEMKHSYSLATVESKTSGRTTDGLMGGGILTLTNCYHVYGVSTSGGIKKTLEEMRSPGMVSLLNGTQGTIEWKADFEQQQLNDGFPILYVRRGIQAQLNKTSINIATMVAVSKSDAVEITTPFEIPLNDIEVSLREGSLFSILAESKNAYSVKVNVSFETSDEGEYKDTLSVYIKSRSARILIPLVGSASNQPFITFSTSSLNFVINEGQTEKQSFTLTGAFLQNDVRLSIEGGAGFSVDKAQFSAAEANAGVVVTVSFNGISNATATLKAVSSLNGGGEVSRSLSLAAQVSPGPVFLEAALTANYDDFAVVRVSSDSITRVFYLISTEKIEGMTADMVRTHPEKSCLTLEYEGIAEALFFEGLQKNTTYHIYLALGKGVSMKEITFTAGVSSSLDNLKQQDYLVYTEDGCIVVQSDTAGPKLIQVYDVKGKQIENRNIMSTKTRIPVLHTGVYIVRVISEGVPTIHKIMVK